MSLVSSGFTVLFLESLRSTLTFSESTAQSQPSSEELMYRFMEMLETGEGSMGRVYKVGAPSQGASSTLRGGEGCRKSQGHS